MSEPQNLTEIVCIIDRSGSMSSLANDAIGGFNTFLKDQQQQPGTALLTLVLFDHEYQIIYNGVDIHEVQPLTSTTYVPRGMTALYDAVGRTINDVKSRLLTESEDKKPDSLLVCIITDGLENSSQEYNREKVFEVISSQEKDGWNFVYLAANQDAMQTGGAMGIKGANTYTYQSSSIGTCDSYNLMSNVGTSVRARSFTSVKSVDAARKAKTEDEKS